MGKGMRLARILGMDVYLDWSLLIVFALVTTALGGGVFPTWHPDWSPPTAWLTALAAALLFFASVLAHELSHAVVGRAFGIEIRRITLFVFGGMAHLEREPEAWRAEFAMALAGPAMSFALGMACLWLAAAIGAPLDALSHNAPAAVLGTLSPAATLLVWLGPVNLVLGLFNLVPGFPLDGGRVLRALLWGATGDLRLATQWAAAGGRLVAWGLMAAGFAMILGLTVPVFGRGVVGGLWVALIGWSLHNAAVSGYRQLLVRDLLEARPVTQLMRTGVRSVEADLSVAAFVDEYLLGHAQRAFPVTDGTRFAGMVCLEDVRRVARPDWALTRVAAIMTPAAEVAAVTPRDSAMQALTILGQRGVNQLPVLEGARVLGLVTREDLLRYLALGGGSHPAH